MSKYKDSGITISIPKSPINKRKLKIFSFQIFHDDNGLWGEISFLLNGCKNQKIWKCLIDRRFIDYGETNNLSKQILSLFKNHYNIKHTK